jgi:hypothetical protein
MKILVANYVYTGLYESWQNAGSIAVSTQVQVSVKSCSGISGYVITKLTRQLHFTNNSKNDCSVIPVIDICLIIQITSALIQSIGPRHS